MGVLNKLFSGGASKLVESVGGVLDNVITTDEEKQEAKRNFRFCEAVDIIIFLVMLYWFGKTSLYLDLV